MPHGGRHDKRSSRGAQCGRRPSAEPCSWSILCAGGAMPKIWRVYSGADGQSHIAEETLSMKPFLDTEGAHGETTPTQPTAGIAFRVAPPGYVLGWHCAPRRQYSISLSGAPQSEGRDGTVG